MNGFRRLGLMAVCAALTLAGCARGVTGSALPPPSDWRQLPGEERLGKLLETKPYSGLLTVRYLDLHDKEPAGDSIIVQSPDGRTLLIDAGIPAVGGQVADTLKKMGVPKLDIAVNTHPHPDHIGGFETVFRQVPVDQFYMANESPPWAAYKDALAAARTKKVNTRFLEEGAQFKLGADVSFEVLNPRQGELPSGVKKFELDEVNNGSIVLKMTYKNTSFLFTGDIHRDRESELVDKYGSKLKADFMDAPHHGITTSSSQKLLLGVAPKVSVISYNKFENYKQLLTYQKQNIDTYVTGLHGLVLIASDGSKLNVLTEKDYPPQK